jgi:hypothetical protein
MKAALLVSLFLFGCASLDDAGCRQADWYDLGFRDAIFGMQRQDEVYVSQCEPRGAKVDVTRYAQGWKEGKWEADNRRSESAD